MAGPRTDQTGKIQKPQQPGQLISMLQLMGKEIARALPKHMTPDRMGRIVLTALRTTPHLAECSRESFAGCVMQLSQLGLEPNTLLGHAWLIPRRSKGGYYECSAIVGYQGYIELARRSGLVSNIYAYTVRDCDDFGYKLGLTPDVHHIPSEAPDREEHPLTHVYAVAHMKDGSKCFVVLSRAQVERRKARSAAGDAGPWKSDEEAMWLKTAVRALWKWLPKSSELARAEALDTAAELGTSQVEAFDPTVTEALAKQGLLAESTEPADAELVEPSVEPAEPEAQPS